ncbi:SDR family NAD(P)-dependent oxidoreductase, partial [Clavibacter michiganensis]|uniref:SDR family NAD(P)-dependent oxidoreductase n=1 Tax=Clavibacter michiganensis TaxID=28447 RepID=UPI00292D561D
MTVTPVSWVIGGGTGIGEASARALARLGGHVVVSGRREQELDRVVAEIRSEGGAA